MRAVTYYTGQAILALAILSLSACGGGSKDTPKKGPSGPNGSAAEAPAEIRLQFARVSRGEISKIINATGAVRPDKKVDVGSEVSGKLLSVNVDFNSIVKAGDVLAEIDPENLQNRVAQNEAQVENNRSNINVNMASLKRAEVNAVQARRSMVRREQLFAEDAISQAQLEETERQLKLADADIELAQARLDAAESSLKQAEATLRTSMVDLDRTRIIAPIDGVVMERFVDPGQTVAASLNAPKLFTIAGDLSKIKVDAAIVEGDVSGLDAGDAVTFSVDAYPGTQFRGIVEQLRLISKNQNNIVTYTAVVSADNPNGQLMPGMTANLQITTNSKSGILRIPAMAERFRPTPDQIKKWKAEDEAGGNDDVDPKARTHLIEVGLSSDKVDSILERMKSETEALREQIADPTQTWRRVGRQKQLRETFDGIIKNELTTPEYQKYRQIVQAGAQVRDAQIWVKAGDKMRQRDVGLGLSDGSFVEVVSGLAQGDRVVTGIGSGSARRGPPGRRRRPG